MTTKQRRATAGLEPLEAYEAHDTDIRPHIRRLRDLVVDVDAKVIVELGVRYGYSSAGLLHGAKATGGHVWSIENATVQPFLDADWTFISGDDRAPAVAALVPTTIDVLFIDTTHGLEHTAVELAMYGSRVRAGGLIVAHDSELDGVRWALLDVWRRRGIEWREWRESHGLVAMTVDADPED